MAYLAVRGLTRGIQDCAIDIKMPAVITASNPFLLDSTKLQGSASVSTVFVQYSNSSAQVAKNDKIFTKNTNRDRLARVHLGRHGDRMPEPSEIFTGRSCRPHLKKFLIRLRRFPNGIAIIRAMCPSNFFHFHFFACKSMLIKPQIYPTISEFNSYPFNRPIQSMLILL